VRTPLPTRLAFVAATLLAACAKEEDTGDAITPYAMPPYGGCAATKVIYRTDEGEEELDDTITWTYDADERLVDYLEVPGYSRSYEQAYAYDGAGCLTAYTETSTSGDDVEVLAYAYTCDGGFPVSGTATDTVSGTVEYQHTYAFTNVVEHGQLVLRTIVVDGDYVEREAISWVDGEEVAYDLWNGERWTDHATWSLGADGRVLEATDEDPGNDDAGTRYRYTYDVHGRAVDWTYVEGVDLETPEFAEHETWNDDLYMQTRIEDDWGLDGVLDSVYDLDCEGPWPWSCDIQYDDGFFSEDDVLDGVPDEHITFAWECP
jgi:hypothetical protein